MYSDTPILLRARIAHRANILVRGVGDIDLLVAARDGSTVVVEIKSFVRWHQFLWWPGPRERAAYEQARRQMLAVGAKQAIVWLPNGRPTFWQTIFAPKRRSIVVVFGSARRLLPLLN